jgi:hypothetical protein
MAQPRRRDRRIRHYFARTKGQPAREGAPTEMLAGSPVEVNLGKAAAIVVARAEKQEVLHGVL